MKFILFVLLALATITLTGCGQEKPITIYELVMVHGKNTETIATVAKLKADASTASVSKITTQFNNENTLYTSFTKVSDCIVLNNHNWKAKRYQMINGNFSMVGKEVSPAFSLNARISWFRAKDSNTVCTVEYPSAPVFYAKFAYHAGIIPAIKLLYKTY